MLTPRQRAIKFVGTLYGSHPLRRRFWIGALDTRA
jgi:hypothetical protein